LKRTIEAALLGSVILAGSACNEESPVAPDGDLFPVRAATVEVRLEWDEFASNLEVLGGFGSPSELGAAVLAKGFAGELDSRALARFGPFPAATSVRDTTGTIRSDSLLAFVSGRVVAVFDTVASTNEGPVTLALGALQAEWDATTATWTTAVDTIHDTRMWPEPGAGPVVALGTRTWDPAEGDSVVFDVDSATISLLADTTDESRGIRLDLLSDGVRLQISRVTLRIDTRASIRPDSLVVLSAPASELTFVYTPFPEPPPDGIRIEGATAWRTVLDVDPPRTLDGPAEVCRVLGCPLKLTPNTVGYAALVFRSRASDPAFQPTDSVGLDVRTVLSREALPKSPLGGSLLGAFGVTGLRVAPEAFGSDPGRAIEIPITPFIRSILQAEADSTELPPRTLALLSPFEPISIAFASFQGPGGPSAPVLRMILTSGPTVELP